MLPGFSWERVNTTSFVPQQRRAGLTGKLRGVRRAKNFRALFCERFQCRSEDFEEQLFTRCAPKPVVLLAEALRGLNPHFFREDLGLIADLATTCSHAEVRMELDRFRGRNQRDRNWLRKRLSLRISGKRVLKLSRKLFTVK